MFISEMHNKIIFTSSSIPDSTTVKILIYCSTLYVSHLKCLTVDELGIDRASVIIVDFLLIICSAINIFLGFIIKWGAATATRHPWSIFIEMSFKEKKKINWDLNKFDFINIKVCSSVFSA